MNRRIWLHVLMSAYLSLCATAATDERILFDAKIKGHPVRLALDTGAEVPVLFRTTADRLGLKVKPPPEGAQPAPGKVSGGLSEQCPVEIGGVTSSLRFVVVDLPSYIRPEIDGLLGWGAVGHCIVEIRGDKKEVTIQSQLAADVSEWLCWNVRSEQNCLVTEIPHEHGKSGLVLIDTGSPTGVHLSMQRWQQWIREHPNQPSTLSALFSPATGVLVMPERWAKELRLGQLTIHEVPIRKGDPPAEMVLGAEYEATLGLYALGRLALVVDGKRGKIYLKTASGPLTIKDYDYNRLGAVFVPKDPTSNQLVAHVVEGGPADDAGIRDNDILLRIDDLDATRWQTDPRILPLSRFWSRPPGTKLVLGLMRQGGQIEITVALQEIFARQVPLTDRRADAPGREPAPAPEAELELIRCSADCARFVCAESGAEFIAWGFNYDHDDSGRLLEDYWRQEWPTVVEDFKEMKALGANVVRIHLQTAKFMNAPDEPNEAALAQLARLVELAEQTRLYLDITGLGCYHKKDVPQWYDAMDEAGRWDVQALFWQTVAKTCTQSPAVFCYDLMNEPILPGTNKKETDWLAGEFAGKHFVQRISLGLAGRTPQQVAKTWIDKLTGAIRKHDDRHMITVGVIPWVHTFPKAKPLFYSDEISENLDFVSVHFYPKKGEVDKALTALSAYDIGKPLVVEEMFPLHCSMEELGVFIDASRKIAEGWIGFYWGRTIDEYTDDASLPAALTATWLKYFRAKTPEILTPRRQNHN